MTTTEHTYQFNAQNRLARVDEGATGEYRYNALGQRVYKKGKALAGDLDGDGLITPTDIQAINGNSETTIDCEGPGQGKGKGQQVACVAKQIKSFASNGQGNGVQGAEQNGSREVLFNYDDYRLLGEYDTSGDVIQETVWLGSLPVATIQHTTTYYIHTDHLGTPRVISDYDNVEVWRWESDPFGVAAVNEDPDGGGRKFTYHLRFAGQYYDSETGKHYNYFRDYAPATGKYLESDPVGLSGGLNTYAYASVNPLKRIDPLGLKDGCPTGMAPDENGICFNTEFRDPPCVSTNCAVYHRDWNTPESNCRMECNVKYQPVCTAVGAGTGVLTTPAGGAAAAGGCVLVKAYVCYKKCDEETACEE